MENLSNITKLLMEWSLKNEEWFLVVLLFEHMKIGIPNKFLYKLPQKKNQNTYDALTNKDETILFHNNSSLLQHLLLSFKFCKWTKLDEWDGLYGYRYLRL